MTSVNDSNFWEKKRFQRENQASLSLQRTNNLNERYSKNIQDRAQEDKQAIYKIDRFIEPTEKDQLSDIIADSLIDLLWRNIFYVANLNGPAVTTTSASEEFNLNTREGDTSSGKYLSIENAARFRCHFYFNSTDALDATTYIASHGTATTSSPGSTITASTIEFAGLKVVNGDVSLVCQNADGTTTQPIVQRIVDDTTYKLEIIFNPKQNAEFYLDGVFVGAIANNLPGNASAVTTLPLMVSIKRGASTNRKVTIESYEYIQKKYG